MKINSEHLHVMNPRRTHITWGIFYVVLARVLLVGLYAVADHIKTHTISTGRIQLSTPYSKYVVGETVSFSITNNYNTEIYVTNQCPAEPLAVYRQDSGKWVRIHDEASAKDCQNQQRQVSIPASSTVSSSFAPWKHLFSQPGAYRLVAVVNNYDSLPYVDFEIIVPPLAQLVQPATTEASSQATPTPNNQIQPKTQTPTQAPTQTQTSPATATPTQPVVAPAPKPVPKTFSLHVNSSGNYDLTALTLNAGDSIQFVYNPPINGEVRTHFTPIAPTTATLSSVTLDSEFTTRTRTFSTPGTWKFKADDHNGNSGTLTVK